MAWLTCLVLLTVGSIVSSLAAPAQQPAPAPEMTTLFETRLDAISAGSVRLSAASLVLSPGATTLPVRVDGVLLLLVEAGEIRVLSDHPIVGAAREGDGTTTSAPVYRLAAGERVSIVDGARLSLTGAGVDPARLFVLSLGPGPGAVPAELRIVAPNA